jgi:hypothetical protein
MSFQLFDRIAAFFRQANIFRRENLFIDQSSLERITADGEFLNFSQQNALLEQTNLQINRLERYKDFDQMDEVGVIQLALDIYADQASLIDPELKHSVAIKAKSKRVKKVLERLFHDTLMMDSTLRPMIRYLVKYGDCPAEIVPTKNRDGVMSLKFMNVYNFTRIETRYGDLVGFFFQDQLSSNPTFMHPWQVMHLRLTSLENIYHPYGRSILDGARKHFKQLRLMEDAALIYRITRAPEKRVFTIPVGNIPTSEVPQYIELIARQFKKKRFFDPATGDVNERWHPLIQEDDFWLPQRADGTGPTITTLPGAENLDDIKDIEYFKKNMVSALKIPFNRVGLGEGGEGEHKSVAQESPEFATAVQHIQREVAMGLKKIAIVHLALMGFNEKDISEFEVYLTASSAIDELYRIETWNSRAGVIAQLNETGLFPRKWLLQHFTDLTDDEIREMEEEAEATRALEMGLSGIGGDLGGGGLPPIGGPPGGGGLPPLPPGPEEGEPPPPPGELAPLSPDGAGGIPAGPPGAPGIPGIGPGLPEGFNADLEAQVLAESAKVGRRPIAENNKIPGLWPIHDKSPELNSGFNYLLNNNELDGLTNDPSIDLTNEDFSEGERGQVLVESILSRDDRQVAIDEARNLLLGNLDSGEDEVDDDEITIADLPG